MTIIIDYGIGNVFSVQRSLERCGADKVKLSSDPDEIYNADRIILPGVGAFKDGMKGLHDRDLVEPILSAIKRGKPFLGICLGMQMLVSSSKEFGLHDGLNLIPGEVVQIIDDKSIHQMQSKIPYIGWAKVDIHKRKDGKKSILDNFCVNSYLYLVHSYHVKTHNINHTIASYCYDGIEVTAAIQEENVIGFQFHPEKSGEVGMKIIKEFLSI